MMERKWLAVTPQVFTNNGTTQGLVKVADTRLFHVKQKVVVFSDEVSPIALEIKRINNLTDMELGLVGQDIDHRSNLSALLTTDNASISAPLQSRPTISYEDLRRAVYEEEPVVALRTMQVDRLGNHYTDNNPLPVTLPPGSIDFSTIDFGDVTVELDETEAILAEISGKLDSNLPGAATEAKQDVGNSSLDSIDSKVPEDLTVTANRLLVDGSGVVQPVSGPLTDTELRAAPVEVDTNLLQGLTDTELRAVPVPISGTIDTGLLQPLTNTELRANPVPISATSLPLPTGASTETTLSSINTKTPSLGQAAMAASVPVVIASDQDPIPITGSITATNPSVDLTGDPAPLYSTLVGGKDGSGDLQALKVSVAGVLSVDGSGVTQPVSLASVPLPTGAATEITLAAINTKTPALGQAVMAASVPVVISSDQSPIPITGSITASNPSIELTGDPVPLYSTLVGGVDGSGNLQSLKVSVAGVLSVDGSGVTQPISASTLPLPTGASTEAKQDDGNASLVSIDGKITVVNTSDVTISSSVLPTGAATAALQTQPGVDIGDVTINNGAAGAAVNIQDGGNSITVDNANLDVALSTRLKPADTLTAVTTVGTITNVVHVDDNGSSLTVDGTFWQATQPISVAALPLPSGAATAALQTQPGVDIGDVTINNASGGASVNIQDGGNSITVDGTFWQATQPISAAALPLPSGAATSALQTQPGVDIGDVTINNASGGAAVNIQDGGNSITVDGPLTDTQLRASQVPVTQNNTIASAAMASASTLDINCENLASVRFIINGTFDAIIYFEVSIDNVQFDVLSCQDDYNMANPSVDNTLIPGAWHANVAGFKTFRINMVVWNSGTADVTIVGSQNINSLSGHTRIRTSIDEVIALGQAPKSTSLPVTLASDQGAVLVSQSGAWAVDVGNASGGSAVNIQDGGNSITVDNGGTFAVQVSSALPAGANSIGTLGANSGVDIGDVTINNGAAGSAVNIQDGGNSITVDATNLDVALSTRLKPADTLAGVTTLGSISTVVQVGDNAGSLTVDNNGTFVVQATVAAGASTIGKAEDVASGSGDVGVPAIAIRKNTPANTSDTDGDYEMLQMAAGRLWTSTTIDAALPAGTNAIGKLVANNGIDIGDVSINNGSGVDAVNIQDGGNTITVDGTVSISTGSIAKAEDVLSQGGDIGVPAMAVQKATPGNSAGTDGDYEMLQMSAGRLWASATIDTALPAGTNRIGSVRLVDSADADLTSVKGTQTSRAQGIQALKDAGRVHVNFWANAAASGTTGTETMITLTKSSASGATSTGTSFTITSGKRFRITSLTVSSRGHATPTAQVTTFSLRNNTGGATIASSNATMSIGTATTAVAQAWDRLSFPIPDGYEILGDGTSTFGLSANAVFTTNAPTWYATITGYEY